MSLTLSDVSTSPAETQVRQQLACAYRLFDHLGWHELIYNHITVRVPGTDNQFLINPFGLMYREVKASNLVKIDMDGHIIGPSDYPVNPAGFVVHSAVHAARADAHAVAHTHTTAGQAVACQAQGLLPLSFTAMFFTDKVAYHDFEGITIHADEAPRLLTNIGNKPLVILRNHGLLAWAKTLPLAFVRLWTLQRACDIQMAQAAMGPAIAVPEAVARKTTHDSFQFDAQFGAGQDVFDALVRQVDKIDISYQN